MPYATQQNMIDRFGNEELIELTDRDHTGAIDATVLNQAIKDASGVVDGYLSGRYSIPLITVPPIIERITCDLARYFLYDDAATEHVQKNHDTAISYLKDASRGNVDLGVDDTGSAPQTNNTATMTSGGRIMGRDDNGFM